MFRFEWNRTAVARVGLLLVCAVAGLSALAGLSVSGRCSGDGTFSLSDPAARVSGYCRATGLASFPDDPGKTALVLLLFGLPVVLAALGVAVAVMRDDSRVLRWSATISAGWVILLFASVLFADVSYSGSG